ncbi:MOSC domain-containing protein [Chitinimonas sp. BJYL2]|uniref:MOSC domain-containing protein n=1 Tax=Chitinimonas sp. BJYL2 TaxID=2976696 RepID=UPI0022B503CE|nr:MOSC domain-containing protein [Chitinimonas sp. BJYL2]
MSQTTPHLMAAFIAPESGAPMQACQTLTLIAGEGIVGDRYRGREQDYPGQNLTLIEAEVIEAFNAEHGTSISLDASRRNLVTRGIRLNELEGRTFRIGNVRLHGVELCDPCLTLGENLAHTGLTPPQVVKAFVKRGGLRVDVLDNGAVSVGDTIVVND